MVIETRDDTELGGKEPLTIKQIVLSHIRKISDICTKEFTGGFWEKKPIKLQGGVFFTEEYHEDMREAYSNAVDFLTDLVYPQADKEFKAYVDEIEEKEKVFIKMSQKQEGYDIKMKLKIKRLLFREINMMFERFDYFKASDVLSET